MKERELLKKAIEALEEIHVGNMTPMAEANWNKAITAIKEALAQPKQEFVAYIDMSEWPPVRFKEGTLRCDIAHLDGQKLYTTPPQRTWVGLTDEEIQYCVELKNPEAIAEEVEAKLKEKNT